MDKHSNLLQKSVKYSRKKFYWIGPRGQYFKHFTSVTYWCSKVIYTCQWKHSPLSVFLIETADLFTTVNYTRKFFTTSASALQSFMQVQLVP